MVVNVTAAATGTTANPPSGGTERANTGCGTARRAGNWIVQHREAIVAAAVIVGVGICVIGTAGACAGATLAVIVAQTAERCYNKGTCRTGRAHRSNLADTARFFGEQVAMAGVGFGIGKAIAACMRASRGPAFMAEGVERAGGATFSIASSERRLWRSA
jgi:hypothetical protein